MNQPFGLLLLAILVVGGTAQSGWFDLQPCDYSCNSCWNGYDPSSCYDCPSNRWQDNYSWWYSYCFCPDGCYDNGGAYCPPCDHQCSTCTSYSYNCNSCNGNYRGSAPSCSCIAKFYDNGSPDCQSCHYSCQTCSSSSSCSSCSSSYNRYFVSGYTYCACPARYYDSGSQPCYSCHPTCLSCYGSALSNCQSCNTNAYRTLSSTTCVCQTSYYATSPSVEQCAACLYSCLTCVTSASNCISCDSSKNRVLQSNSCPCTAGYFQNSSSQCQLCSHQCATCVSNANNCLTCNPNRISAPTCACLAEYYDDGSPSCKRCQYSCSYCSSSSKCDTCNASYQRQFTSVSTYCVCPDRYYDPGSQVCNACDPTCFRCSSSTSSSCTACNVNAFRVLSSSSCVCKTGYYVTSTTLEQCSACLYSCLTCTVISTNCTTCNSTLNRVLTSNSCPCAPTYFQNSSLLCDTCQSTCATCTSKLSCITCFSSQLTIINSTGFCSCAAGKFWNTNICSTCSYFCLTCTGSASNCTSCPTATNRVFSIGSCNCLAGFYDNSVALCVACYYTCVTCTNGLNTGCTSCNSGQRRVLSSGQCSCPTGYYDDGSNAACVQCNYKCLTCNGPSSCLTCNSSLARSYSSTTGYCQCYSNYYESNYLCYACISTCVTCTNGFTCTTCNSALNRFLNTTTYTCDCIAGYYANSSNLCTPCNALCVTCNSGTTCLTCKGNLNRTYNSNTSTCDCYNGYILISSSNLCLTCQSTCYTCVTNYTNRCATCDNTTSRFLNSSTYQCQCPIVGYYDDGVHTVCGVCSYTCLTCSLSSSSCTACPAASNRVYSSSAGTCNCAQHYYDNNVTFVQNVTCLACKYYCSTCMQNISCLTCNSTNFRVFNSVNSKCLCLGGYYDDGTNEKCAACNYKCLTCTNSSTCLACNSSWNRDTPSSTCPCSTGYYDVTTPVCLACQYSCLTCTVGNQCATCQGKYFRVLNSTTKLCSCIAGYYDPGTAICQSCSYSCVTCVTSGDKCLTCSTTYQRTYNSTSQSCPCNNGFYDNAGPQCLLCNYTCSTCSNNRSCLSCNLTRFRTINSLTGLCVCITSYYDNNTTETCLACQATCLNCINSTNCTSCDASRNRVLNYTADYASLKNPFCPCLYKYYSLGLNNSCSACHFSCSYCSGPNITNCLFCSSDAQRKLQTTGNCTCNNGYYDTNSTQSCPACNIACLTCWNKMTTTCFTCNSTNFMMIGADTCYVNCPTYYFNNVTIMVCQLCQVHCLTCQNSTNCSLCEDPMFLYKNNCQPKCPLGYYPNSTTHSCELCRTGCENCTTSYNCFKCVNSSYYADQATTLCQLCSTACLTCFGPSQNNCLSCTYPQFLNSQYMCVNLTCSYGKYLDSTKGCVSCNTLFAHSITCNITEALLCENSYLLSTGKCVKCNQVKGYALDSYNDCNEICGDGILIYYQCDDGNNLNGDGCSANCIIEDGWNCSVISHKSKCKLKGSISLYLHKVVKIPRENTIRITLKISLPLRLNNKNFQVIFTSLSSEYYAFDILAQDQSDLTFVTVSVSYTKNIQNEILSMSYSSSRRLQELESFSPRLLQLVTFESSLSISAFPPANYITQNTYTFYDTANSIIFSLGAILTLLNLIVVPKKFALHSITFSWIVPYLYFTLFYSTSYTSEWIASAVSQLKYSAAYFGFSIGQCCTADSIQNTTSQIMANVGGILIALLITWVIFVILYFFNFHIEGETLLKCYRMFKYFLLTAHLFFLSQLTFASLNALTSYTLNNRIDAVNITFGLFMLIGICFFIASLWYITRISKFDGSFDEMSSKAATRHTIEKQPSNNTEQNDSNVIINLTTVKEMSRYETNQFNNTHTAFTISQINGRGTHTSGFSLQSRQMTEESEQQEQMGEQESFFPYDYCLLYKHTNKGSKYFLPLLATKIFAYALFSATLSSYPFEVIVIHLLLSVVFLIYLCSAKPFQSKFTLARVIVIQLLLIVIQTAFTIYQFYAQQNQYIQQLEFYIVLAVMVLLFTAIIFVIIEHFRVWFDTFKLCCESCCLFFKLRGKSEQFDYKPKNEENVIKIETVNQSEIGEVDAFYARMLQKQALNKQYKRERMIYDTQFEKSFA